MKTVRIIICLALVLLGLAALPGAALADGTPPATPESLVINVTYPRMEAIAGSSATFEAALVYIADSPKVFDLQLQAPTGWDVYVNPQFSTGTKISSIRLDPASLGANVKVVANVPLFPIPAPGSYKITLTATSGTVKASADLTVVVTPTYALVLTSATDQIGTATTLDTTAQAGKDDVLGMKVLNLGTAATENISFSSTKPTGWVVNFSPDKIDSLSAFNEASVDVTIRPDAKAIPGDYMVSLSAGGPQATAQNINVRVTVAGSSVWVWVQLVLGLLVVAGLVMLFLRPNRR